MKMIVLVSIQANNFRALGGEEYKAVTQAWEIGTELFGGLSHPAPHEGIQPTAYSVRSCVVWSEPCCC